MQALVPQTNLITTPISNLIFMENFFRQTLSSALKPPQQNWEQMIETKIFVHSTLIPTMLLYKPLADASSEYTSDDVLQSDVDPL